MATLVCFHAHPDDEAIATGGVMAQAAAAGHRVVLVVATRGEVGEVAPGFLEPGEELWERRVAEVTAAASILGAARLEFLGYRDSGMVGTSDNDDPSCFWQAGVDDAAGKLAAILARGGRRRPHRLRRVRRVRPSRPHPGPPRRRARRGDGRYAAGVRGDHGPRHGARPDGGGAAGAGRARRWWRWPSR